MKKIISSVLAVIMVMAMSVSVFAENFVGSIEAKPAPEVIEINEGGNDYGAVFVDDKTEDFEEGVPLYDEKAGSSILEFVVVSAAEKDDAALTAITAKITAAEKQIKGVKNLGKLTSGLDTEINAEIDKYYGDPKDKIKITDLIVSDLFDASLVRDKSTLEQVEDGQKLRFTIKPSFAKNDFFVILHNTDGSNWEVVEDVEWTDSGNLIITVDKLSVFAIAVERSSVLPDPHGPDSPDTGNENNLNYLCAGIAIVCLVAAAVFFVMAKKRRKA